jgi:hypothetical protein
MRKMYAQSLSDHISRLITGGCDLAGSGTYLLENLYERHLNEEKQPSIFCY